jgi:hypothetical protein
VVVQGGLQPQRLMRLELAASGSAVEAIAPMAVDLPQFDQPGVGAILGNALYYFANSGAEESGDGLLVLRTSLDAGKDIVPPDIRKFQEKKKHREQ